jgi:phosphoglycolate phosphatase-like HAD superfamily hydrolase
LDAARGWNAGCSFDLTSMEAFHLGRPASAASPNRFPAAPLPAEAHQPRLDRPRVLLCDLDGTLVDTMPILADLAAEVLESVYGMPRFQGHELYLSTSGIPFIRQLDIICPGDARNPEASARFEAEKPARCSSARLPADARRALIDLRSLGTRIVVSSNNGVKNVASFARVTDFSFDLVLGYDGNGLAKGRPHIACAAAVFGATCEDMVLVGDSLHDGEIAEREGVRFVGVAGTFSRERFALRFPGLPVLDRLAEITQLFG